MDKEKAASVVSTSYGALDQGKIPAKGSFFRITNLTECYNVSYPFIYGVVNFGLVCVFFINNFPKGLVWVYDFTWVHDLVKVVIRTRDETLETQV
jgi:hypothetical protein